GLCITSKNHNFPILLLEVFYENKRKNSRTFMLWLRKIYRYLQLIYDIKIKEIFLEKKSKSTLIILDPKFLGQFVIKRKKIENKGLCITSKIHNLTTLDINFYAMRTHIKIRYLQLIYDIKIKEILESFRKI
ncbi:hypothetical protein ACJX0J_025046, partial [Zea mays]